MIPIIVLSFNFYVPTLYCYIFRILIFHIYIDHKQTEKYLSRKYKHYAVVPTEVVPEHVKYA